MRILSTKKLAKNQRELLLNSGIGFVEYDAIITETKEFQLNSKNITNAIFTSQNAVKSIENAKLIIENCFCVGDKTSDLLKSQYCKVCEIGENARDLSQKIIENYREETFVFFCGNKRRDELPENLKNHGIKFQEVQVYETILNFKAFQDNFDTVLFFSPSGVKSFVKENSWRTLACCIGETTAAEAKKNNFETLIAGSTSVESVIAKAIKTLKDKHNDQK